REQEVVGLGDGSAGAVAVDVADLELLVPAAAPLVDGGHATHSLVVCTVGVVAAALAGPFGGPSGRCELVPVVGVGDRDERLLALAHGQAPQAGDAVLGDDDVRERPGDGRHR